MEVLPVIAIFVFVPVLVAAQQVMLRVSVGPRAVEGNGGSHGLHLGISAAGNLMTFLSVAGNLVPDDTNNQFDVFVHDRGDAGCTATLAPSSASTGAELGGFWGRSCLCRHQLPAGKRR